MKMCYIEDTQKKTINFVDKNNVTLLYDLDIQSCTSAYCGLSNNKGVIGSIESYIFDKYFFKYLEHNVPMFRAFNEKNHNDELFIYLVNEKDVAPIFEFKNGNQSPVFEFVDGKCVSITWVDNKSDNNENNILN